MSLLLKLSNAVFILSVCAIVFFAGGVVLLHPQVKVHSVITQSCIVPEVVDTKVVVAVNKDNLRINCQYQKIKITKNGSLIFKPEGEFDKDASINFIVRGVTVEDGGVFSADNTGTTMALANIPLTVNYVTYVAMQHQEIRGNAALSGDGVLLTMSDQSAVLGVKDTDTQKAESEKFSAQIRFQSADNLFVQDQDTNTSETLDFPVDNIVSQIMDCAVGTKCVQSGMFTSQEKKPFDVVIASALQYESSANISAEAKSAGTNVLGISGKMVTTGGIVDREGKVTLQAVVAPRYYTANEQHLQLEFEVKEAIAEYDGLSDIYLSKKEVFTGNESVSFATEIQYLKPNTAYKWRVRIVNTDTNEMSEWFNFAGADDYATAFVVTTAKKIQLSSDKYTLSPQDKLTLTVKALDAVGNIDTSFRGTVYFTSDQLSADLPLPYTFTAEDKGQKEFTTSAKFYEAGTAYITAAELNNTSLSSTASFTIREPNSRYLVLTSNVKFPSSGETVTYQWRANGFTSIMVNGETTDKLNSGSFTKKVGQDTFFEVKGLQRNGSSATATVLQKVNRANVQNVSLPTGTIAPVTYTTTKTVTSDQEPFPPLPTDLYPSSDSVRLKDADSVEVYTATDANSCPTIESFTISTPLIKTGTMTQLSWIVKDAEQILIDAIPGNLPLRGTAAVELEKSGVVTLKAIKGKCHRSAQIDVSLVSVYPWEGTGAWLAGVITLELLGGASVVFAAPGMRYNMWSAVKTFLDRLRKKKRLGIVYDIDTKQPMSGIKVDIYDRKSKALIASAVSDNHGFIFVSPLPHGTYSVAIHKYGYKLYESSDANSFDHHCVTALHKKHFTLSEDNTGLIAIPLAGKKNIVHKLHFHILMLIEEVLTTSLPLFMIAGFFYSVFMAVMYPIAMNILLLGLYIFFVAIKIYIFLYRSHKYGTVKTLTGLAVPGVTIGLFNKDTHELLVKTQSDTYGGYVFFVPRGSYYIKVIDNGYRLLGKHSSRNITVAYPELIEDNTYVVAKNLIVYPVSQKHLVEMANLARNS